ncbi:MAG: ABC transporter substrate-binding protein [Bacillota bacterium]|nr:ABC transporter substrate-binding protein [Bacillota bacterium]
MIKHRKWGILLLVMLLFVTACGSAETTEPANEPTADAATQEQENEATETEKEETKTVVGHDGKEVELPGIVERISVYPGAFNQMTAILSEGGGVLVAASTDQLSDYFKQVFPDYVEENPNNYNSTNVEDIIASGAQVATAVDGALSEEQIEQLEAAGIPFVSVTRMRTVDELCESYLLLGEILGGNAGNRAKEFVDYYQASVADAREKTKDLTEEERVRFLLVRQAGDSRSTINSNDISQTYIEAAGGINVAADAKPGEGTQQIVIDAEQIVAWNPEVIMAASQSGAESLRNDPALATVDAVVNDRVIVCPYGVYMWSVRSGEGAMLTPFLGTVLHPERFSDVNMEEIVRDFFQRFYQYEISDEEIQNTLNGPE